MKYFLLIFLLISSYSVSFSQEVIFDGQVRNPLYSLEKKILNGDKDALRDIGKILSSRKKIYESLGYHLLQPKEREIALRIIEENTLFLPFEIILDSNLTANDYLLFFNKNYNKIYFKKEYGAFLITPLEERNLNYKVRRLSTIKKDTLEKRSTELLNFFMDKNASLHNLIKERNPLCLKEIAEAYFRYRIRYDRYNFKEEEQCIDLLKLLTNVEIGMQKTSDSISYDVRLDFTQEANLETLIYWTKHYSDYEYNEHQKHFINTKDSVIGFTYIEKLFDLLTSLDDTIAFNSYEAITDLNPSEVIKGIDGFKGNFMHYNYNNVIGSFPDKRLEQLSNLTFYCRENNIDYKGNEILRHKLMRLNENLEFKERLKYEDYLIENLTFDEITPLEYWASIYDFGGINTSAARILDVFYSRHWMEILNSPERLNFYVRKVTWFDNFSTHGTCYAYYRKFENSSDETNGKLKAIDTSNSDIKIILNKIFYLNSDSTIKKLQTIKSSRLNEIRNSSLIGGMYQGVEKYMDDRDEKIQIYNKFGDDNFNSFIDSADIKIMKIISEKEKFHSKKKYKDEKRYRIDKIISQIDYKEILQVLKITDKLNYERNGYKYRFLVSDFGFPLSEKYEIYKKDIDEFTAKYKELDEYNLYSYYLDKAGIDYKNSDGSLDFDKIYWLLKYGQVRSFMGGIDNFREKLVYSVIKLLELNFNTTLGFPLKLCNSGDTYGCTALERAEEWRLFLIEKKLISFEDTEPRSFFYE